MVERFHKDMKAALRSHLNGPNWDDELPWVLLGLRTAPKEDIHTSAAEMVYGTPLTVPDNFVCPSDDPVAAAELLSNLRDEVLKLRPTPVLRHGTAVMDRLLPTVIHIVFIRTGHFTCGLWVKWFHTSLHQLM